MLDLPPDRQPPHPARAEQRLLASMMLDGSPDVAEVFKRVRPADFTETHHRTVFGVLSELSDAGKPTDAMAVHERLDATGRLEGAGGVEYLVEILTSVASADRVLYYARLVREAADHRGGTGT